LPGTVILFLKAYFSASIINQTHNFLITTRSLTVLFTLCIGLVQCQRPGNMEDHAYTNKLIHESSPYLLQHAHNPVDWYPWGDEALQKAKDENKLLLISIGYSSCHWCHVMEHESFEDTTVANFMNKNFVCIKVDREERPDIDDVYMTACQLASGGGCGWPLNSFALPDGRPVWAGTYFPKSKWMEVLDYFRKIYTEDPAKLQDYATRLVTGVQDHGLDSLMSTNNAPITTPEVLAISKTFMDRMDPTLGGRRGSPKFPMPNNWEYLMHYSFRENDPRAKELVMTTLDRMMMGGIYDQLEGGFARYSTDSLWLVPHFEKMLYDNGQLVSLYAKAYAWTGNKAYLNVVNQTLDFVDKNWSDDSGGFYSSYDADSEGEEGKYYVSTTQELEQLIPNVDDRKMFYEFNDIRNNGNWEDKKNILQQHRNGEEVAKNHHLTVEAFQQKMEAIHKVLLTTRQKRVAPGLDDKILTSWNGLMLQGYIDAYRVTSNKAYLTRALKNATFLRDKMIGKDHQMMRNFKNGKASINAFLDDYAITIQSFLAMYQCTFDTTWLDHAKGLTDHVLAHFDGDSTTLFYYTSDLDQALIARRIDFSDNVIPGSNSIMAKDLYNLGTLLGKDEYIERANKMLQVILPRIKNDGQPSFYSNWCELMLSFSRMPYEVAVVGKDYGKILTELQLKYQPDVLYLGGAAEGTLELLEDKLVEGQTFIYVCQNKVCKIPTEDIKQALELMKY